MKVKDILKLPNMESMRIDIYDYTGEQLASNGYNMDNTKYYSECYIWDMSIDVIKDDVRVNLFI